MMEKAQIQLLHFVKKANTVFVKFYVIKVIQLWKQKNYVPL